MNKGIIATFIVVILLCIAVVAGYIWMMSDEKEAEERLDIEFFAETNSSVVYIYRNLQSAESFIPTVSTITKVEIFAGMNIQPPDDLRIGIKSELEGNFLTFVDLTSDNFSGGYKWREINFTDIRVTPGETYYIVCKTSGGDIMHAYTWRTQYPSEYKGEYCETTGETWNCVDGIDAFFRVYGYE